MVSSIAPEKGGYNGLEDLYQELKPLHLAPLWEVLKGLVPDEPKPRARPFGWSWIQVREKLVRAGALISAADAERRVLVLENPALPGQSRVTDTLYAGVQSILPREVAPAHRHTQSALRFVLEGEGGYTSVDGARTEMRRGDFIITPRWTWHDHGNDGSAPVFWLDGLDVPLVSFLNAGFREGYPSATHVVTRTSEDVFVRHANGLLPINSSRKSDNSPIFNYPYHRTRDVLERLARQGEIDPHHGVSVRYTNPLNGDWAMATIACSMRLIPQGMPVRYFRSTDSAVLVAVEGEPLMEIEGQPPQQLGANDVFAIPGWMRWRVRADRSDAVVFVYSDRPVHEKLALYREERS
jgi:gentisate 1,2-dioxygenase